MSKLIVISAPSGAGKTTIAREILARHPGLIFSVSATTRKRRSGETEGKDYFFMPVEDFEEKIRRGELAEWEKIYGDYYGTLARQVEGALRSGRPMLFDIDVNGALSLRARYPDESVLIFIEPPDIGTLAQRLRGRNTEDTRALTRRIERVPMEMEKGKLFDFRVVNSELDQAVRAVEQIIGPLIGVAPQGDGRNAAATNE